MSSLLGSIGENNSGNYYIYRSSKAALNMCVKGLSVDLASQGVTTVALHPGWVKTDMGGSDAIYEVNDSVSSLIKVIEKCDLSRSGGFYSWQDQRLSW
jgi:NAD(P)-dependent dehydrogenase (short-subunit alcohol dehydrogenase family)